MPPQPVILESQNATSVADAQQSSGKFASANPTKGEEDARVQERGIRAKISLNPRSHLQHFQRPTPSDLSKNAPSLQGVGHAGVARSRRRRMISAVKPDEPALNFQQRDNAKSSLAHLRRERDKGCPSSGL